MAEEVVEEQQQLADPDSVISLNEEDGAPAPLEDELRFMAQLEDEARSSYCGPLAGPHLCRHVLVRGRELVASFPTFLEAYGEGVRRFGVGGGFLVRQALLDPAALMREPIVQVEIGVPAVVAIALERAGRPIPQPRIAHALIDSGASDVMVDVGILAELRLGACDRVSVAMNAGDTVMGVHAARLSLPTLPAVPAWDGPVLGARLAPRWHVLLGRTFLERVVLVYHGPEAYWVLSEHEPEGLTGIRARLRRGEE